MEKRTPHHDLALVQAAIAQLGPAAFLRSPPWMKITLRESAPVIQFKEK